MRRYEQYRNIGRLAPIERVMLAAFGVFCFVYPFAMLLLSLDRMPFGMEWMSSLLLATLGVASWSWLAVNFGKLGMLVGLAVFASGLILEYVGVLTGVPFGRYEYTGVLVPVLPGAVPLAIGFAWLLIVVGGLFTAGWLFSLNNLWLLSAAGAVLAVGLDLLLEPVAYHIKGYWVWLAEGSGYYGVPITNFATWFVAALIMNRLVSLLPGMRGSLRWKWLPVALYSMNVLLFGVVNVAHGFWVAGLVSLALLALVWTRLRATFAASLKGQLANDEG